MVSEGYLACSRQGNSNPMSANLSAAATNIWKILVPSKVRVFGWRCLKDSLATKEQFIAVTIVYMFFVFLLTRR